MLDRQYWTDGPTAPSADTAIEQARGEWERMYRDAQAAGREVPVVDVPASLGDVARASVEATSELARRGRTRSFVVNIDLRALEAAYQAEQARLAAIQAAQEAARTQHTQRQSMPARAPTASRREVSKHAAQASGVHRDADRRDRPVRVRRRQVHRAGDPAPHQ